MWPFEIDFSLCIIPRSLPSYSCVNSSFAFIAWQRSVVRCGGAWVCLTIYLLGVFQLLPVEGCYK